MTALDWKHKYFRLCVRVSGYGRKTLVLHKLQSLSIGEHIATAFANILRHSLTLNVIQNPIVQLHYGYVDDTLSVLVCQRSDVDAFSEDMNNEIAPMRWTHEISSTRMNFLDIDVKCLVSNSRVVTFETSMYRKPNFQPHFLSVLSNHPSGHKHGIFKCEAHRALMLCSKQIHFDSCITQILLFLEDAGYSARCFPVVSFSSSRRSSYLSKIASRKRKDRDDRFRVTADRRSRVVLSVPFSTQLNQLGLCNLFRASVGSIIPIDLRLGWSVKINSMRRLYRLNWPSVRSMGIG